MLNFSNSILALLIFSGLLRYLIAFFASGYLDHSELIWALEPIASASGWSTLQSLETQLGAVSSFSQQIHFAWLKLGSFFGLERPTSQTIWLRLLYADLSLLIPISAAIMMTELRKPAFATLSTIAVLGLFPSFAADSVHLSSLHLGFSCAAAGLIFLFLPLKSMGPAPQVVAGICWALAFFSNYWLVIAFPVVLVLAYFLNRSLSTIAGAGLGFILWTASVFILFPMEFLTFLKWIQLQQILSNINIDLKGTLSEACTYLIVSFVTLPFLSSLIFRNRKLRIQQASIGILGFLALIQVPGTVSKIRQHRSEAKEYQILGQQIQNQLDEDQKRHHLVILSDPTHAPVGFYLRHAGPLCYFFRNELGEDQSEGQCPPNYELNDGFLVLRKESSHLPQGLEYSLGERVLEWKDWQVDEYLNYYF